MDPTGARSKEVFLAGTHPEVRESFCQSAELSLKEFFCLRRGMRWERGEKLGEEEERRKAGESKAV